ncbi:MAG: GYD domain-containing protein [bacterium]
MPAFLMFGKYSSESLNHVSPDRTDKAVALIKRHGGNIKAMYALLGEHDLVFIVDFPTMEEAMVASIGVNKLTGISFATSPALSVEKFDKMLAKAGDI